MMKKILISSAFLFIATNTYAYNEPVAGVVAPTNGGTGLTSFARSGNTTTFATTGTTLTPTYCLQADANGNIVSAGGVCTTGGGGGTVTSAYSGNIAYYNANGTVVGGLTNGTNTQVLIGGSTPSWGMLNLSTMATGTLQAAQAPAFTGDCTSTAGALVLTCTKTSGTAFGALATLSAAPAGSLTGTSLAANVTSAPGVTSLGTLSGLSITGNLGINTTAAASLDLGTGGLMQVGATGSAIAFNGYYNSGWKYKASDYAYYIRHDGADLGFWVAPGGTAGNPFTPTQAVAIASSGNVGIGTASPSYLLDVNGTLRATTLLGTLGTAGAAASNISASNNIVYAATAYGVKCDGTTDNASALNSIASTITAGTTIEFPGGTCVFKSAVTLPNINNLTWHFNGSTLLYTGSSTTGNLITAGVTGSHGAAQSFVGWVIEDLTVATNTVMTSGDGFVLNDAQSLMIRNIVVGQSLNGNNNFYNGFHLNGGNTIYISQFSFRGSNAGEVINGETSANGGYQMTDAFHNLGAIANGNNYGLLIAGNCGGCQWDNTDVVGNHINVRIDRSVSDVQNRQVRFMAGFASDGTSGGNNIGVNIADAGASGTQLFCIGCWISTASAQCLYIENAVTWEIHLIGARIENCPTAGIENHSGNIRMLISGGVIAQSGYGINNTPSSGTPYIQFEGRPAFYGNTTNEAGMTPTISSGCGGSGSSVTGDDYNFFVSWGATAGTTCILNWKLAHTASVTSPSVTPYNANVYTNIGTSTTSQLGINANANLTSGQGLMVSNSGSGF